MTLIEMVVAIVLTAILMAMAAPLLTHLIRSYVTGAQGADLATAAGPAVARMQWDGRNAYQMVVAIVLTAILLRAMSIISRCGGVRDQFTFTGGVAKNEAAVKELRNLIVENYGDVTININPDSIYTGALGAATFARRAISQ